MSTFKSFGIIINEHSIGESDKLVTILLKGHGKISVSARGAKKAKSKLLAPTQLFTYSEFVIYNSKTFFSIAQAEVIENFYNLRNDYEKFIISSYMAEICNKTVMPETPCDEVFLLFLKALSVLQKGKVQNKLILSVFIFKLMQYYGFSPELNECSACGMKTGDIKRFSHEGVICGKCIYKAKSVEMCDASIYAINYTVNSDLTTLFNFMLEEKPLNQFYNVADLFLNTHMNINFKTKKFINNITNQ